ncbi:MAG: AI-2E family transporter [Candidatus Taylorbacteria bacterium]|nr:AI-2E family transporter [Candidatus Taylorbacteria bacterium]
MINGTARIEITTGTIVKAILLIVTTFALFSLKGIVLVVLTAVVIASSLEPMIKWFMRRGVYRVFSALIVYALIASVLVGAFYTLVPQFLQDTSAFLNSVPEYLESTELWNPLGAEKTEESKEIAMSVARGIEEGQQAIQSPRSDDFSIQGALQGINEAITAVSAGFVHSASSVFGGIISFFIIIALSFYLAVQDDGVEKFLRVVIPASKESYVIGLWRRTQTKIGLWMQGQLVLAILVGILVYLGLMVLGVKNALLFAVLAAFLEMIPLFGPIIAAVPAVASVYLDGGATSAFIVAGLYLIIQQFENHLIYPLVVKKIVGIPPILVILSLLVGFELAGFLGIILSVPVASMLMELIDDMQKDKRAPQTIEA